MATLLCVVTLLFYYRTHVFEGELHFTLDKFDGLIQASILEHWYGVYRGWYDWRDPIFFYPNKGVLGYSDAYFLYGILYSGYRTIGLGPLAAMELTTVAIRAVGFFAAWALLRRYFGLSVWATAFGAILATIANGVYLGTTHTQLATVAFVPLVFCLAARVHELITQERTNAATAAAIMLGLLLAVWSATAFYTFWFTGLFVLIGLAVALSIDRATLFAFMRETLGHGRWWSLAPGVCVFLIGLIPLALIYAPAAGATGMHGMRELYPFVPRVLDMLNLGPDNLAWSSFYAKLGISSLGFSADQSELWVGFTPVEFALLFTVLLTGFEATRNATPQAKLIYRSLLVSVFVAMALQVQVHGVTLWQIVYKVVPGARALRVVARFQIVLLTVGALLAAVALDKFARSGRPWRRILAITLGAIILVEQINTRKIANFTKEDVVVLQSIPSAPRQCRTFYTVEPVVNANSNDNNLRLYVHSVEAMLLAVMTRLPTVLGMDTFVPPGWNLIDPFNADYEQRVYDYAERNRLLPGLCAFDLTTLKWRSIDAPPGIRRTPDPNGRGLADRDIVSFAAGEPAVAMLVEGWSDPEHWGAWAIGEQSRLALRLDGDAFREAGAILRFTIWAFLPPDVKSKGIEVFAGGGGAQQRIARWSVGREAENKTLCIPAGAIAGDGSLSLTFTADRSYSPSETVGAGDPRVLNFAAQKLSVHAGPCPPMLR